MADLRWNTELINSPQLAWGGFLVCLRCRCTWRGLLPNDRPGVFGLVEEQCPDCDNEDYEAEVS